MRAIYKTFTKKKRRQKKERTREINMCLTKLNEKVRTLQYEIDLLAVTVSKLNETGRGLFHQAGISEPIANDEGYESDIDGTVLLRHDDHVETEGEQHQAEEHSH